jgi:polysaccharide export outer membrane protein
MTTRYPSAIFGLALAFTLAVLAPPVFAQSQVQSYILGPDDVIDVQVYGQFDQPIRLRVRDDGTVALPLIGSVAVAGKTPGQFAEDVRQAYIKGGYFTKTVVNVEVVTYLSRSVTVLGAVRNPGVVALVRPTTLSHIVAQTGGQIENANAAILRRADGTEKTFVVSQIAGTAADPVLVPGDVVIVPPSQRYFVYGQARSPGAFPLETGMTVRQALASAGGQNDSGTQKELRLYRAGVETAVKELDQPIMSGDVLYVRERVF